MFMPQLAAADSRALKPVQRQVQFTRGTDGSKDPAKKVTTQIVAMDLGNGFSV